MNKFRLQVTLSLGVIVAIAILVIALLDYLAFRSESRELNLQVIAERNAALEASLSEKLLSYQLVLSALKVNNHTLGEENLNQSNIESLTHVTKVLEGKVNGVYLFDKSGAVYKMDGNKHPKDNYKNRSYYKALFERGDTFYVSKPYVSKKNNKRALGIAYKVNDEIAISATLFLDGVLGDIKDKEQLYLWADGGSIVVAPDRAMLGERIKNVRPEFLNLNADNTEYEFEEIVDGKAVTHTGFWGRLKVPGWGKGWQYVATIETSAISQGAQNQLFTSLLIGLVCFLLSCGIIVVVMNRLVLTPVGGSPDQIAKLVETMASGNVALGLDASENDSGIYRSVISFSKQLTGLVTNSLGISERVSTASENLTQVMNDTLNNIEQEKVQVELISTAISELSSTSHEVSEKAKSAEEQTMLGVKKLEAGKVSLEKNIALSSDINTSVTTTANIISELQKFSIEIGSVTDVINGISEQTNLLALNAAIEAARAGEAGRGFAVVADEVRALASKTQESTLSIQDIISKLQGQSEKASSNMNQNVELIESSVVLADQVKAAFEDISQSIEAISEINSLVAIASQEQNRVTDEISENTAEAFNLVQENTSAVTKTLHATEELAQLAQTQKDELAFFKV